MPKATCVVPAEFQTWRRSPPAWFTKRTCTVVAEPFQVDSNEKVSSVSVVVRANTSPTSGRPEIPPVADMSLGAGAALSIVTLPFTVVTFVATSVAVTVKDWTPFPRAPAVRVPLR